jgi:uncharacterized RDD family membrane protein YckC
MAESNIVVETPEQVGIDFEIAGVGSSFMAAVLDLLVMLVLLLAAFILPIVLLPVGSRAAGQIGENLARGENAFTAVEPAAGVVIGLLMFLVVWGYYLISELVTDGRSPGKRALGLRVVREDGLPIGAAESAIRNLVRLIDFLPMFYGVGLVTLVVSPRTQRLGDLAAGTLVVKDRAGQRIARMPEPVAVTPAPAVAVADLLTRTERDLVDRFLARRLTLDDEARKRLARSIAAPLRARLGDRGLPDDEAYLQAVGAPGAR